MGILLWSKTMIDWTKAHNVHTLVVTASEKFIPNC